MFKTTILKILQYIYRFIIIENDAWSYGNPIDLNDLMYDLRTVICRLHLLWTYDEVEQLVKLVVNLTISEIQLY